VSTEPFPPSESRLPRYCRPLRHPSHPSLSLTSPLIHTAIAAGMGLPVLRMVPFDVHAFANAPAGLMELVRSYRSTNNKRSCGRSGIDYYAGIKNFAIYVDRVFVGSVFS
jgi:hypothetical protein